MVLLDKQGFGDVLTIVLAGGQGERLYPLTKDRAKPAVCFGGNYRLIDFTLSNCVNSGIRKIYVFTQYMSTTLDQHIKKGWNIFSHELGEFIQTVPPQKKMATRWYEGTADAIFQNLHILQEETPERVLILSGDHVYKMDYREMLRFHLEKRAHLTVGGVQIEKEEAKRFGVLGVDRDNRIICFEEKPSRPRTIPDDSSKCLVSMGVYIFETEKLVRALIEDTKTDTEHDFGKNIIPQMLKVGDVIYCYDFLSKDTKKPGYWRDIGTIDSYWEASMDLLDVPSKFNLYDKSWLIRTYQQQTPPVRITLGNKEKKCFIINSLVCAGCFINGASVEKSILSSEVEIESSAEVSESIIMKGVRIGQGARVKKAIIDEEVTVPRNYQIGYKLEEDTSRFIVSPLGVVVVPRGMHLD